MNAQPQLKATRPSLADDHLSPVKFKSGLDPESQFVLGETREEFAELQTQYFNRFAPATPEERFQVDNLIRNEWSLRRFFRVEAQLWEYHTTLAARGTGVELGEAFTKAGPIFMRLQRRITAAEKAYKEAMAELRRLQDFAQPAQNAPQTLKLGSFLAPPPESPEIDPELAAIDALLRARLPDARLCIP